MTRIQCASLGRFIIRCPANELPSNALKNPRAASVREMIGVERRPSALELPTLFSLLDV